TLWEGGVPLAGSTDCPVEPLDAMAAIGQMVHRPDWSPDEGIPLDATLQIFSEGSYALQGYRRPPGGWGPGRRADFVVLDRNPWRTPPEELEGIPIGMTVVDGRIVYGG
ncbi:MAG: amidohydrolase family protein, partial [Armatimonadetes bacterium]|nr:amidohydrolase family protein [Armatimonadota bacterium]